MDQLPPEILSEIACLLPTPELRHLRFANRYIACSVIPVLFRSLSVINTAEHIEGLIEFIKQSPTIARFSQKLTVFHATWHVCERSAWENHPLLFGGKDIGINHRKSVAADKAFQSYTQFADRESLRDFSDMMSLISIFENLQVVRISHIKRITLMKNPQCRRLLRRIWLGPCVRDSVVKTATLQAFVNIPNTIRLDIDL